MLTMIHNKRKTRKVESMKKLMKRILLTIVIVISVLIVGLIVCNRIFYVKYNKADTTSDHLSVADINRVYSIYNYLSENGDNIFNEFDGKDMNLLIYNEAYEFLFSDCQPSGQEWTNVGKDEGTDKSIYRRIANNSQAFAVKVDASWVGSFATMDTYHKQILKEIPIFYPPQLISLDESYYTAIVIHEMLHAFQGRNHSDRVDQAEHIGNVGSTYYEDSLFNTLMEQEAKYLEAAIQSEDTDTIRDNIKLFLQTRIQRRLECHMTDKDIYEEKETEWLEGLARYAEFKASRGSSSLIAKGLSDISEKVKIKSDDRYYTLGMAEYMIISKSDHAYDQDIFKNNVALEDILSELFLN